MNTCGMLVGSLCLCTLLQVCRYHYMLQVIGIMCISSTLYIGHRLFQVDAGLEGCCVKYFQHDYQHGFQHDKMIYVSFILLINKYLLAHCGCKRINQNILFCFYNLQFTRRIEIQTVIIYNMRFAAIVLNTYTYIIN